MNRIWVIASVATLAACSQAPAEPAPDVPAAESGDSAEAVAGETSEVSEDVAALTQAAPLAELTPATCTAEETPIFSCTVKGGKRLSVCGSKEGPEKGLRRRRGADCVREWRHALHRVQPRRTDQFQGWRAQQPGDYRWCHC